MTKAFILVNTETENDEYVFETIKSLPTVKEIFRVYTNYDIILLIEEPDMAHIKEVIFHKLRMINGLKSTLTILIK